MREIKKEKEYERKRNEDQLKSHKREIERKEEILKQTTEEFETEISKKEKISCSLQKEKADLEDRAKREIEKWKAKYHSKKQENGNLLKVNSELKENWEKIFADMSYYNSTIQKDLS